MNGRLVGGSLRLWFRYAELGGLGIDSCRHPFLNLSLGMDHSVEDPDHPDHAVVRFPYSFPEAGQYRIYVQMKRNQKILNGAFDVEVTD